MKLDLCAFLPWAACLGLGHWSGRGSGTKPHPGDHLESGRDPVKWPPVQATLWLLAPQPAGIKKWNRLKGRVRWRWGRISCGGGGRRGRKRVNEGFNCTS
ncbi:hypothetical protein EDB80DRAFT_207711 [Ilyonectria destructans]|nr:hypothetical protein EDB80DRAFT_207711 [Ilyonectria destructans]